MATVRKHRTRGLASPLFLGLLVACSPSTPETWWRGNLHTHSLWSDGDDYPEMVIAWYRDNGYDFIALSDHNVLAAGERWVNVAAPEQRAAFERYRARFDSSWVEFVAVGDTLSVRLKTLEEYRVLFEEGARFLILQSEEITDRFETTPVHVNATNLVSLIAPQGGTSVLDVLQNNVDAVLAQRRETGQPMFPHVNHPNFGWAITAEDLIALQGERFFEVYNGHPLVHNEGDAEHPGMDRLWDIVLAERLTRGAPVLYGIAVDDAHHYHTEGPRQSNPGRGWIMVRAGTLTPEGLVAAMEAGDFYASTGVSLDDVRFENGQLSISIVAEPGVTYRTQFIGTRRGYPAALPAAAPDSASPVRFAYSEEIGTLLSEVAGTSAAYSAQGDELYVRAKIVSSRSKPNAVAPGEVEVAWTQPVVMGSR
jgi:hypothetical protein